LSGYPNIVKVRHESARDGPGKACRRITIGRTFGALNTKEFRSAPLRVNAIALD